MQHLNKQLIDPKIKAVMIDVTESLIERQKKGQKQYYSGNLILFCH